MTTVLFACVHNAGRSQMAAALFNQRADPAAARAVSAGTRPAARVHAAVVDAMRELGVDLSDAPTTLLTDEIARIAQVLITMGCGDVCPVVAGAMRDDWRIDDPAGQPLARVRAIRDEISTRVERLIQSNGWGLRPA